MCLAVSNRITIHIRPVGVRAGIRTKYDDSVLLYM